MGEGQKMSTPDLFTNTTVASPDSAGEVDSVAEARARVEETRAHLSDTVDALKDRLSPAHIAEEAKDAAIEKVHDVASGVVESVKTAATSVADSAKDLYHAAADKVSDIRQTVADRVTSVTHGSQSEPTYGYTSSGTDRSLGATIVDTIKLNPVPAAIVGFGLGWLVLSIQKQQRTVQLAAPTALPPTTYDTYDDTPYGTSNGYANTASNGNGLADRASGFVHGVTDKVSDAAHVASQKASDLTGKATEWAGGVRDTAGQWKDKAGDTVNNFAVQTKTQAGAASDSVVTFINEQPLAAAGIAFIIGAAFASSLPTTQKENDILGPPRDRLVDQGKGAAQDVAQKVQSVATTAFGQAKDSLSHTVDQAKQQIQQTVQQTHDTVVSEAHNQGLVGAPA